MTKTIQNKSITTIIAITTTIALLGLSSVFITNQEALAEQREIPDRGYVGEGATISCVLNREIPADPLRVNIMVTVAGFHTVIMEKEIFNCIVTEPDLNNLNDGPHTFPVIFQDTLLIQYNDNKKGIPKASGIEIELISCIKDLEFTEFGPFCFSLGSPLEFINELDCRGDVEVTEAFVDMDSTSFNWEQKFDKKKVTYKTVIVEKEILDCSIRGKEIPRIAEVFTIEEKVNGNVQPFKWVVCEKDPVVGILGCITSDSVILNNLNQN